MTVTERLMRPSTGSLGFRSDLPVSVSEEIRELVDERNGGTGAHVVITSASIDPAAFGDTAALAASIYTGRIIRRPSRTSLEWVGIESWLDSYLDTAVTRSAGTPSQWLGDLLDNDLSAGTVDATGATNVTRSFPAHITTRRQALDVVAGLGGWEWKVQPDFTVDAAVKGTLFRSPPEVVVTRKDEGPDGSLRGVQGGMLDQSIDVSSTATKAVALAQGIGDSIAKGTATDAVNLLAPLGSAPEFVTVFSAPSEEDANANTAAQNFLNLQGARYEITVNSRTHTIPTYVVPGDEVYLYDAAAGIVDTSNEVQFRGETIFPALVRCTELTWPIEQGYGVYIRPNGSSPTWIDVTPWVEWETGDAWWTVGDWSPGNYGRANRTAPEIEDRIGGVSLANYTPTLSVIAIGTGGSPGNSADYSVSGSTLTISGIIRFGSSGQTFPTAGNEGASLPDGFVANVPSSVSPMPVGTAVYWDASLTTGVVGVVAVLDGATAVTFNTNVMGSLGAATPFAWAASDEIRWHAVIPVVHT